MIGALISALFTFLMNLIATVIQVICLPLNKLIEGFLPDLADQIISVTNGFNNLFSILPWALSLIPLSLLITFGFCYSIKLVVSTISISSHNLVKVWNIFQKIKFW